MFFGVFQLILSINKYLLTEACAMVSQMDMGVLSLWNTGIYHDRLYKSEDFTPDEF